MDHGICAAKMERRPWKAGRGPGIILLLLRNVGPVPASRQFLCMSAGSDIDMVSSSPPRSSSSYGATLLMQQRVDLDCAADFAHLRAKRRRVIAPQLDSSGLAEIGAHRFLG